MYQEWIKIYDELEKRAISLKSEINICDNIDNDLEYIIANGNWFDRFKAKRMLKEYYKIREYRQRRI